MAALRDRGVATAEIARRFGVSVRTVQRGLRLMKQNPPSPLPSPVKGEGETKEE